MKQEGTIIRPGRIGECLDSLGEAVGKGIALTGVYLTLPVFASTMLIRRGLNKHGIARDKQEQSEVSDEKVELRTPSLRKRFNRSIRYLGNKLTPWNREKFCYGFGDLLTEDINFTRIGLTAGALAPIALQYHQNSSGGEHPIGGAIVTYIMWPIPAIGGAIGAVAGAGTGYILDNPVKVTRGISRGIRNKISGLFNRKVASEELEESL